MWTAVGTVSSKLYSLTPVHVYVGLCQYMCVLWLPIGRSNFNDVSINEKLLMCSSSWYAKMFGLLSTNNCSKVFYSKFEPSIDT